MLCAARAEVWQFGPMFTSKAVTARGSKPGGSDPAYRNFSAEVDLQRLTLQIVAVTILTGAFIVTTGRRYVEPVTQCRSVEAETDRPSGNSA